MVFGGFYKDIEGLGLSSLASITRIYGVIRCIGSIQGFLRIQKV